MAVVKPFKAMRFTEKAGELKSLICPPYDIISDSERKEYIDTNANNIIRLELPRESDNPYQKAGDTLKNWLSNNILAIDGEEALYIYEETFLSGGIIRKVKGFTVRVGLEEFSAGIILPHEETLSKAKTDRFNLMCATKANFSAIYSLYFDEENKIFPIVDSLSKKDPDENITDQDGVTHKLWAVTDPDQITRIAALMSGKKIYIADGHHRYETALNYKQHLIDSGETVDENHPANYIMMHLVNIENGGLVVFPTHRIIKNLEAFDDGKLLSNCEKYFDISDCKKPGQELGRMAKENKKAFVMYAGKNSKLLVLKDLTVMDALLPGKSQAYKTLDVSILHTLILERLLGIDRENMANQKNLVYTRDISEAFAAVDSGEANCAFIINPTKVPEIAAVAAQGEKMPQKSTYFYPKLITGLVTNPLSSK